MAKTLVVFTKNNARILTNPENFSEYIHFPNAVPDPNLLAVKGIPPHFWKLEEGLIVPMTSEEKEKRIQAIEQEGVNNEIIWIGEKPDSPLEPQKKEFQEVVIEAKRMSVKMEILFFSMIGLSILGILFYLYRK